MTVLTNTCIAVDLVDVLSLNFDVNDLLLKPTFPCRPQISNFVDAEREIFKSAQDYARRSKNHLGEVDQQMAEFSSYLFDRGVQLNTYRRFFQSHQI